MKNRKYMQPAVTVIQLLPQAIILAGSDKKMDWKEEIISGGEGG